MKINLKNKNFLCCRRYQKLITKNTFFAFKVYHTSNIFLCSHLVNFFLYQSFKSKSYKLYCWISRPPFILWVALNIDTKKKFQFIIHFNWNRYFLNVINLTFWRWSIFLSWIWWVDFCDLNLFLSSLHDQQLTTLPNPSYFFLFQCYFLNVKNYCQGVIKRHWNMILMLCDILIFVFEVLIISFKL